MSNKKSQQKKEEQEQEKVWMEIFELFDKDKNGHVSKEELGHVLRALDMDPTQKELDEAVKELDKDGNGIIEYADFRAYMLKKKKCSYDERKDEMMRAFRLIDKNNDKFIDATELMGVLTSLGEPLSKEEVEAMIKVADVNKDGKIDYEEFVNFILSPCLPQNSSVSFKRKSKSSDSNTSSLPSQPTRSQQFSSHSGFPSQQAGSQQFSSHGSLGFFYTADSKSSASYSESHTSQNASMASINQFSGATPMNVPTNVMDNGNNNISSFPVDENDNLNCVPNQNTFQHK